MADSVNIIQDSISVNQQNDIIIDNAINAEVVTIDPSIQVNSEEYVLSSGGMYGGSALVGAVPQWILDAVQQQLTTGNGNIMSVVTDIQTLLGTLQTGVTQMVDSLNTLSSSTSSITTGLQSEVNLNHAEVLNVLATKVDSTQAQAIATTAINSTFNNNVNSYIANIASTYVNANSAIAQEVGILQASLGDVTANVSDISSVTVEYVLNPAWIDDGFLTDPDINGEPRYVLQAKAKKQLQVDANGIVTALILESGATSSITMQADQFKLVASGQSVASRNPFTVNAITGQITFDGIVDFTNTNTSGTTTIDGSKITTGSITAGQIAASTITSSQLSTNIALINGEIKSSDFTTIGGAGFRLKSSAADTYADPTIYGAYIRGGTIDGAVITGEVFDVVNMKVSNNSTNTGSLLVRSSTAAYNSSLLFYNKTYGTGYLAKRLLMDTQKIYVFAVGASYAGTCCDTGLTITVQYSTNNSTWYDIASKSISTLGGSVSVAVSGELSISNTAFSVLYIRYTYSGYGSGFTFNGGFVDIQTANIQ